MQLSVFHVYDIKKSLSLFNHFILVNPLLNLLYVITFNLYSLNLRKSFSLHPHMWGKTEYIFMHELFEILKLIAPGPGAQTVGGGGNMDI